MSVIIFLLILSILVLVHEFGHFIAAKKNGVLVEEFGLGFPPRLIGKKIGETLYSLNLIPLGGFVKLYGEEYNEKINSVLKTRAFVDKKPSKKALIVIGGVVMNIVLAVAIFYGLLVSNHFQSEPIPILNSYHFTFGQEEGRVVVSGVAPNSPASHSGVHEEDTVLRFRFMGENNWHTITSANQFIGIIKNAQGKEVQIELVNIGNGEHHIVSVVPQYNAEVKRAVIGINLVDAVVISYNNPGEKIFSGFLHSYNLLDYNVKTIGYLITSSLKSHDLAPVSRTVSGPIGIFSVIDTLVRSSGKKLVINLANIVGLLSLSLAIINIFPFPALDGGRLVFVVYEWISSRRVNPKIELYLNYAGFILLILLAILVSINDIRNFH